MLPFVSVVAVETVVVVGTAPVATVVVDIAGPVGSALVEIVLVETVAVGVVAPQRSLGESQQAIFLLVRLLDLALLSHTLVPRSVVGVGSVVVVVELGQIVDQR